MKHLLSISLAFLLLSCSTMQEAQFRAVADPVTVALISGYAESHGIPPALTGPIVTTLQSQAWGIFNQVSHQQPATDGASIPSVGAAVAATNQTPDQLITAVKTLAAAKSNPTLANALLTAASAKTSP